MERAIDSKSSRVVVHTFAEGMLARLAKDLEIEFPATGSVTIDAAESRAEISFDVERVRIVGIRKNDATDESALSRNEREDIAKKFKSAIGAREDDRIVVAARVETNSNCASIDVSIPCGKTSLKCTCEISRGDESSRVKGDCDLSLRDLGVRDVKGPLGAFRLSDRVRVRFDVTFR